ncbi:MAG: PTS sugar transporter subunit IIA [Gemmatimonadota bacterium]|nr:PTS sugar transporter subunit IIA [Gemmatimonadota bacterium]|tara:strand:- start:18 stop:470 length:453 start_codon:yes stop_codon:yes gene_type:complete
MHLRELFTTDKVKLDLESKTKGDILKEMVSLLGLGAEAETVLLKTIARRENLGSTGIGSGIAIPHCRSLAVSQLHIAYGRKPSGVDFNAIDREPVYHFFLIVAPPLETSNSYLPVLGKVAQFAREPTADDALMALVNPEDFLHLLNEHGL